MDGLPWVTCGDFNIYLNDQERSGGANEGANNKTTAMLGFAEAINDCHLMDPGFDGPMFTWARGDLFERLDRILINEGWTTNFSSTRVSVLPRVVYDHGPLVVRCLESEIRRWAPFRFQNMWTRHHLFLEVVKKLWDVETGAHGMRNLQIKLGHVKAGLKQWNKEVFGNIFNRLSNAEIKTTEAQCSYEDDPMPSNREMHNRCTAEYLLCLRMEKDFWRQKANLRWVVEGERNTKFYQGWVRKKWVRLRIHEIRVGEEIISNEEDLRNFAALLFQKLLTSDVQALDELNLEIIKTISADLDVESMCSTSLLEEVKQAVFGISADSASGLDGLSSFFFQTCWEIFGVDVVAAVGDFFAGGYMPRSFTSTMIVLLPKKENPST